ncbi:MAG: GNAT family N-acetyltransferase [Lentimicrobiaceae bacterium]|nr:GNAT family N-acetyltransferase [Lentimicrobiaceae bacterium]
MKLFRYGIELERLRVDDIEMVREWRNADRVRLNMAYQQLITADEQNAWFETINNANNNYLIIKYKGEKIGLLNDKNINWKKRTSESGLFIGKPEYYATFVPLLVSVAGIQATFGVMGWNRHYARILKHNTLAINFNKMLGYQLVEGQEGIEHQLYEFTYANFLQKAGKISKAVASLAGPDKSIRFLIEEADYKSGIGERFETALNNPIIPLKQSITPEGLWFEGSLE